MGDKLKLFLIIGPTLLFWVIGILKYPPDHKIFLFALQNAIIFLYYMILLTLSHSFFLLGISSDYQYTYYVDSLFSFWYMTTCLYIFVQFKRGRYILISYMYISKILKIILVRLKSAHSSVG